MLKVTLLLAVLALAAAEPRVRRKQHSEDPAHITNIECPSNCECKPTVNIQTPSYGGSGGTVDWLVDSAIERVAELNAKVAEQDSEIEGLVEHAKEKNAEIKALEGHINKKNLEVEVLLKEQAKLKGEISELKGEISRKEKERVEGEKRKEEERKRKEEEDRKEQEKKRAEEKKREEEEQKKKEAEEKKRKREEELAARPKDCSDILLNEGKKFSGIYHVYPVGVGEATAVFCDMNTDGGGWTVFQRRVDGFNGFNNDWLMYKKGFGNPAHEFWMGNRLLNKMTNQRIYELRVDLQDFDNKEKYAVYDHFTVGNELSLYRLTVGKLIQGNAGDSLTSHNNAPFSTLDKDNDQSRSGSCSQLYGGGGFWYNRCYDANLNGQYLDKHDKSAIVWYHYHNDHTPLKHTEMKFRPYGFKTMLKKGRKAK